MHRAVSRFSGTLSSAVQAGKDRDCEAPPDLENGASAQPPASVSKSVPPAAASLRKRLRLGGRRLASRCAPALRKCKAAFGAEVPSLRSPQAPPQSRAAPRGSSAACCTRLPVARTQ